MTDATNGLATRAVSTALEGEGLALSVQAPNRTARTDRDETGRFVLGNKAALGHGGGAHNLSRWRRLAHEVTTDEDHVEIWRGLIESAKNREPWAVVVYLNYTHGRPPPHEVAQELDKGEIIAAEYRRFAERVLIPEEVEERAQELASERIAELERRNRELFEMWSAERRRGQ